jgi:hypothetical protein
MRKGKKVLGVECAEAKKKSQSARLVNGLVWGVETATSRKGCQSIDESAMQTAFAE